MTQPLLAIFNLGGGEIILILATLLLILAIPGAVVVLLLVLTSGNRGSSPPGQPSPSPGRPKSKTANCPRCGSVMPSDSPQGLCPRCVLGVGLGTTTEPEPAAGPHGTRVLPPPPKPEDIAGYFPQLEIFECLGRGGMGVVYKARQPLLNRFVALKVLAPEREKAPQFAERFTREAQALARLSHPNIIAVYDFGETNGLYYLLMEFVDGMNLRQLLQSRKLAPEEALAIVPKICEALQYAHEQGIVHRDIKPENVLLDKQGRLKIADFGIAKILGSADAAPFTDVKDVMGTPYYMAPEQIEKPTRVDHRADIYSLGVVFYEMLTGELPLGRFAPPSRKVQVDVRLDDVVLRALEKDPELRYQQASQVRTAVENITTGATGASSPQAEIGSARLDVRLPKSPTQEPAGGEAKPTSGEKADALAAEILARDYELNIGHCFRRGWALVRGDFWPLVGSTALVVLLFSALGSISSTPKVGEGIRYDASLLSLLLDGPLMGGLWLLFLKRIRGEAVRVETAFLGFSMCFLQLMLAGLVRYVLTGLGLLCLLVPGIYLLVAWHFTLPLVIDRQLDFWPAMRLSRKVISKHWWKFFGFVLTMAAFNLAGVAMCCLGFLVTFPISLAALMYAYEDIFSGSRAGAPDSVRAERSS